MCLVRCGTKFELFHCVIFCSSTQTTLSDEIDSCQPGEETTNANLIDTNIKDKSQNLKEHYKIVVPKHDKRKEKKIIYKNSSVPSHLDQF